MPQEKTIHTEIGGFVSTLMREHFGKGPTSIYVSIAGPFITIHLRGCLTATEKILLKQNEVNHVYKIRDLIMEEMIFDIKLGISKLADFDVKEVYADWNFENESGVIIGVMDRDMAAETVEWPEDIDKEALRKEIIAASIQGQKEPGITEIYWLNDRTILIKRTEIFVQIEKELIKTGFTEELKLAKRPLEYRLIRQANLKSIVKRDIIETFVDWNFNEDKGYMALILDSPKKRNPIDA
jgi:uncharacterized protein YbcI